MRDVVRRCKKNSEGGTDGSFTLTTEKQFSTPTVINLSIAGTATNGEDYTLIPATVTFPANSNTATIGVEVSDDMLEVTLESVSVMVIGSTTEVSAWTKIT